MRLVVTLGSEELQPRCSQAFNVVRMILLLAAPGTPSDHRPPELPAVLGGGQMTRVGDGWRDPLFFSICWSCSCQKLSNISGDMRQTFFYMLNLATHISKL